MTCTTQTIPTDDALALVADRNRRAILCYLIDNENTTTSIETLVAEIAGSDPVQRRDYSEHLHELRTSLHHTHLPKLAETDVVDYDREGRTVRYRPNDTLEDLIHFVTTTLD